MGNSLQRAHPELVPKWSDRNLPLTLDKITFGSNKRVWWKGAFSQERKVQNQIYLNTKRDRLQV